MGEQALAGLRVIDLTADVAGAMCTKLLADFGAEVLVVERPDQGGFLRRVGPFLDDIPHPERAGLFLYFGANKKSITFDPGSPGGRQKLEALVRGADVLVVSSGTEESAASALDRGRLAMLNEGLVITDISPFGMYGRYTQYQASDLILEAMGGWMYHTGEENGVPQRVGSGTVGNCVAGLLAAAGTLGALFWRRAGGKGQRVDVSAMEALINSTRYYDTNYAYSGDLIRRVGQGLNAIYRNVPCQDGYGTICVSTQLQWEMLCHLMGLSDLVSDPRFLTIEMRKERRQELEELTEPWFRERRREETFHAGQEWRVPFGMVCRTDELPNLAQHQVRHFFVDSEHPIAGKLIRHGPPFKMNETPWQLGRAPLLGEHEEEIASKGWRPALKMPPRPFVSVRTSADENGAASSGSGPLPLEGVRILDLTTIWAGPMGSMILADLGAEVIKIEPIQRPDGWRGHLANLSYEKPHETSPSFNTVQRNKYGLTLNLGTPRGVEIFKELAKRADVVMDNYSPRVMPQFGLSYDTLKEINPGLIVISMTGLGSTGPWRDYVSYAPVGEGLGGISHLIGEKDGPPLIPGAMMGDSLVGLNGAVAVLMALIWRQRTGKGQRIDESQLEVSSYTIVDAFMDYSLNGRVWDRMGNRHGWMAPHGCYPARGEDEWIAIATRTEEEWRSLVQAMGDPEWATAERFSSMEKRWANQNELDGLLGEWTSKEDKQELMERLQAVGVAAGAVLGPRELLRDEHLKERGFFEEVDRRHVGVKPYPGLGIKFSETPCRIRRPAPCLGEHNEEVLRRILGLTDEELAALEREQIIGKEPVGDR